jgi:23S rRNA (pseudouridine1915-N3)-methyltransferase
MHIDILAIGDKLPQWANNAVEEYCKRIKSLGSITITELPIEKRSKSQSLEKTLEREGKRMLKLITPNQFVAALEITGKLYTSETFAHEIKHVAGMKKNLTFLIGGPNGLSPACLKRANSHWSLSTFTLPHSLARIIIVEQLYRAQTILSGHPYHK